MAFSSLARARRASGQLESVAEKANYAVVGCGSCAPASQRSNAVILQITDRGRFFAAAARCGPFKAKNHNKTRTSSAQARARMGWFHGLQLVEGACASARLVGRRRALVPRAGQGQRRGAEFDAGVVQAWPDAWFSDAISGRRGRRRGPGPR